MQCEKVKKSLQKRRIHGKSSHVKEVKARHFQGRWRGAERLSGKCFIFKCLKEAKFPVGSTDTWPLSTSRQGWPRTIVPLYSSAHMNGINCINTCISDSSNALGVFPRNQWYFQSRNTLHVWQLDSDAFGVDLKTCPRRHRPLTGTKEDVIFLILRKPQQKLSWKDSFDWL